MSIENAHSNTLVPVSPDGDAVILYYGSMSEMMKTISKKASLPDGSIAMTNSREDEKSGALEVIPDATGEHMRKLFAGTPEGLAAFDAWTERAKLTSGKIELPQDLSEKGGAETLTAESPKLLAVNVRGELDKPNLLATLVADGTRVLLVEKGGQAYALHKRTHKDNTSYHYQATIVEPEGNSVGVGTTEVQLKPKSYKGLSVVELEAQDKEHPIQVEVEPTFEQLQSNQSSKSLLRAIRKGIQLRRAKTGLEPGLDFDAIDEAITRSTTLRSEDRNKENERLALERDRLDEEKKEREAVSISHLSEKYPQAGNFFTPGATLSSDKLWQNLLLKHGIDASAADMVKIAVALKSTSDPTIRVEAAEILRARLDAWCDAQPALRISNQFWAQTRLEEHSGLRDSNFVKTNYPEDSLVHFASSEARTVANSLVPNGALSNRQKVPKSGDHPSYLSSRDYVVRLALAMLDGSFDAANQEDLYNDIRFTDEASRVLIHEARIAQHRTAANMILYGRY